MGLNILMTNAHDGVGKMEAIEVLCRDRCSTALNGMSLCERTSARWVRIPSSPHAKFRISKRIEGNKVDRGGSRLLARFQI